MSLAVTFFSLLWNSFAGGRTRLISRVVLCPIHHRGSCCSCVVKQPINIVGLTAFNPTMKRFVRRVRRVTNLRLHKHWLILSKYLYRSLLNNLTQIHGAGRLLDYKTDGRPLCTNCMNWAHNDILSFNLIYQLLLM